MDLTKGADYIGVCVVHFCHDGKGNFLMQLRSKNARDEHGSWDIGAGSVDFGNTIEETLRQEVREEYATDPLEFEFLGFRDVFREHSGQPTHWVTYDCKVLVDPQKVSTASRTNS